LKYVLKLYTFLINLGRWWQTFGWHVSIITQCCCTAVDTISSGPHCSSSTSSWPQSWRGWTVPGSASWYETHRHAM